MNAVKIFTGDALQILRGLPDQGVHCCVTSPLYFGLRDYGVDGQVGKEKTPEEYVKTLVTIFREVRRVLRDDGTFWLNLGDSYAANRTYQVASTKGGPKHSPAQGRSGTTGKVALAEGRRAILIDINPDYTEMCRETIFQKNNLTEKQESVNMPSYATKHETKYIETMNPKSLALIAGILATAFGQIKNVLTGSAEDDETPAPKKDKKPAKPAAKDEDPDDDDTTEDDGTDAGVTTNIEDDEDVEAVRAKAKVLVGKLIKADAGNKKKIRAALDKLGESTLGEMDDDKVPAFYAALKKIK